MKFDKAEQIDSVCYQIRLADFPRGQNRARINNLFNGGKPFENDDENPVNINFLEGTIKSHEARSQFYSAFLKPGKFFTATTDAGPKHKRSLHSGIVTAEVNRPMKRSMIYFESFRSKFAMDVLHGISPSAWKNRDGWRPDAVGIEDVGIPANTLLTMENLPFFYVRKSFTVPELIRLTTGPTVDEGWKLPVVKKCIEWADTESMALIGSNFPEIWSPEKVQERLKGDGGFYASDQVPTIDCFDFYFWNDDKNVQGWNRRIILDAWSTPQGNGGTYTMSRDSKKDFSRGKFLFNSGTRKYASKLSELVAFQFADLSAVAPFRYHSVRSLGWLLYGICNLQNRMRCRFSVAVLEALMNYFRVKSMDDVDRALHVDMVNKGFIDETIQFIPPQERWQVNAGLIELGINSNREIIDANSSSWTQQRGQNQPGERKTKFQVMAEMNMDTAMVSTALSQAYLYQAIEYRESFRRFCRPKSCDPDVIAFRANCLRQGVPESLINNPDCWEIEPERIMGAGNKTLEMAIAEQLMAIRNLYDPEPQREILRDVTMAITDDPDRAERLVPIDALKVSDSIHDAQLAMGALMQGLPVAIKTGQNHQEYIATLMHGLNLVISRSEQSGGMATMEQIQGFQAVAQHVAQHIQIVAKDKNEKSFVASASKELSRMMNLVKAFIQRLQQQAQQQQEQNAQSGGVPPEATAKIQATQIQAQTKAKNTRESHAAKTAQRNIAFENEEKRKQEAFVQEQKRKNLETAAQTQRDLITHLSKGAGGGESGKE